MEEAGPGSRGGPPSGGWRPHYHGRHVRLQPLQVRRLQRGEGTTPDREQGGQVPRWWVDLLEVSFSTFWILSRISCTYYTHSCGWSKAQHNATKHSSLVLNKTKQGNHTLILARHPLIWNPTSSVLSPTSNAFSCVLLVKKAQHTWIECNLTVNVMKSLSQREI